MKRAHRNDEPSNANDDDDDMDNRPFTLNDGDELSDDEQLDDTEPDTPRHQHIRENFKVDNERGRNLSFFFFLALFALI